MIIIALCSILLMGIVWIHGEYSDFHKESVELRSSYIQTHQQNLQQEVDNVIKNIEAVRAESEQRLKIILKERVDEACAIAQSIYEKNRDSKEISDIQKMVKDALRPIRFLNNRGYYFAVSMAGVEQLYPVHPELEGADLSELKDSKGSFAIQDEIAVVKNSNEGFVRHFWGKPNEDPSRLYQKLSLVKYFEPFDWYFGAGEYLEDYDLDVQKKVLQRIVGLRFGNEGYFFGSTFKGDPLFSNGKITAGTGSIWGLTDPNGIKIIQEQSRIAQTPEGGFVQYSWQKLNETGLSPKMSFVKGIGDWEWTIGAGLYLDSIEKTIARKKETLVEGLKQRVLRSILTIFFLLLIILFWSNRISIQIKQSINAFSLFLKRAGTDLVPMNEEEIELTEFREIAVSVNGMLKDRKHIENTLKKSDEKWQFALEGAGDGVWDWDAETDKVYYSSMWKSMLGFSDNEIGNRLEEWDSRVHPEDKEAAYADLEKHFSGKTPVYMNEHRVRCKDGSYKWILDRGKVIERTVDGKPRRVIGTHSDISERKTYEAEREMLIQKLQKALQEVNTLSGLLPICSHCKKIRDDKGYWNQIDAYFQEKSDIVFSHGICQDCAKKYYPEYNVYEED